MKNISAALAVILLTASGLSAAEPAKPSSLTFGLKGGVNLAKFTGSQDTTWKIKTGAVVGAFLTLKLSNLFSLQPEILFSQKGAKYEGVWNGATATSWANLNSLDVPVLIKFFIPTKSGSFRPNLCAGPCLSLNLSGRTRVEYAAQTSESDIEGLKSLDIGLALGGGVDVLLGSSRLTLDARYVLGLTKIVTDWAEKNGVISILIGFAFGQ